MKYKAGDRVWIADTAELSRDWSERMNLYIGKILTIVSVSSEYYSMKEDGGKWAWTDEMIDHLRSELGYTTISEIDWTEGSQYTDNMSGVVWMVQDGDLVSRGSEEKIVDLFSIKTINTLLFRNVVRGEKI